MEILFTNWIKNTLRRKNISSTTAECKYNVECVKLLQLIIDNEADEDQKKYFSEHLKKCVHCVKYYDLEQQIKQTLKTKIPKKNIPTGLVESIKYQINQTY